MAEVWSAFRYSQSRRTSNQRPAAGRAAGRRGSNEVFVFALQRGVIRLAGADADDAIDIRDEDLAVADLAGLGGLQDRFDHLIDEVAVRSELVDQVIEAVLKAAKTGKVGDGKIFVTEIERAVRIRTGETDNNAL